MPSLTEEEYAGFHGNHEKVERKRSEKEKEGNSRRQNIVQKLFVFS